MPEDSDRSPPLHWTLDMFSIQRGHIWPWNEVPKEANKPKKGQQQKVFITLNFTDDHFFGRTLNEALRLESSLYEIYIEIPESSSLWWFLPSPIYPLGGQLRPDVHVAISHLSSCTHSRADTHWHASRNHKVACIYLLIYLFKKKSWKKKKPQQPKKHVLLGNHSWSLWSWVFMSATPLR